MQLIIKLINRTEIDLGHLVPILNQNTVNKIDASGKQPIAKFSDAVGELLVDQIKEEVAYQHVFQSIYIEVPMTLLPVIDSFPLPIVKSLECGSITVNGFLTASLYVWKRFVEWGNKSTDKLLNAFVHHLNSQLK